MRLLIAESWMPVRRTLRRISDLIGSHILTTHRLVAIGTSPSQVASHRRPCAVSQYRKHLRRKVPRLDYEATRFKVWCGQNYRYHGENSTNGCSSSIPIDLPLRPLRRIQSVQILAKRPYTMHPARQYVNDPSSLRQIEKNHNKRMRTNARSPESNGPSNPAPSASSPAELSAPFLVALPLTQSFGSEGAGAALSPRSNGHRLFLCHYNLPPFPSSPPTLVAPPPVNSFPQASYRIRVGIKCRCRRGTRATPKDVRDLNDIQRSGQAVGFEVGDVGASCGHGCRRGGGEHDVKSRERRQMHDAAGMVGNPRHPSLVPPSSLDNAQPPDTSLVLPPPTDPCLDHTYTIPVSRSNRAQRKYRHTSTQHPSPPHLHCTFTSTLILIPSTFNLAPAPH
ncbi:hypothetical protein R3P38DRAFT_3425130 [Favolaschia claudopus]|uniref:Uncharacterized protein n=1 Tax=Favolaschia claudopus TaxID=2862362 RepID=A0AAV9ZY78_9AGAR